MRAPSAAYLPRGGVVELLRAALLDGDEARAAWQKGRAELERPGNQRSAAANWLRPLLGANLMRNGVDDPLLAELRAQREVTREANGRLFDHIAGVIGHLEREGIPAMLLKGGGLVGTGGEDESLRPMSDVDLLVPWSASRPALDVVSGHGWQARHTLDERFLSVKHAAHFADAERCQLDLHWYVYEECARPGVDDGVWERSLDAGFRGTVARRPGAADALLHACVHGARWTRTPGIRWVTDAWRIIERGDVAWDSLIAEARRRKFVIRVRRPLRFLRGALGAPIPAWVETELSQIQPGMMERLEHATLGYEQRRLGALPGYVFAFHRARSADGPRAMLDFPDYLAAAWGASSATELVTAAATRAANRLTSTDAPSR